MLFFYRLYEFLMKNKRKKKSFFYSKFYDYLYFNYFFETLMKFLSQRIQFWMKEEGVHLNCDCCKLWIFLPNSFVCCSALIFTYINCSTVPFILPHRHKMDRYHITCTIIIINIFFIIIIIVVVICLHSF